MRLHDILVSPKVTEKSVQAGNASNSVSLIVHTSANKDQIKAAVEKIFNVKVASVRTAIRKGKNKKRGKKFVNVKQADSKIAFISLSEGSIDLYPKTV
ncbi:MAG: 50S ribosomal protein L23 [Candidatus Roizmanbacteria bacterium]